jgi:hypothetical protein
MHATGMGAKYGNVSERDIDYERELLIGFSLAFIKHESYALDFMNEIGFWDVIESHINLFLFSPTLHQKKKKTQHLSPKQINLFV